MSFFKDRNCYMKNYNLSLMEKIRSFDYLYLFFISLYNFLQEKGHTVIKQHRDIEKDSKRGK